MNTINSDTGSSAPVATTALHSAAAVELFIDLETASTADLRKKGVHGYAEADTRILLFVFKFGDGETHCIDVASGEAYPPELMAALKDPRIKKIAYNAAFDMAIIRMQLGADCADPAQWIDAHAIAKYLGLHGSLDQNAERCGLPADQQKLKSGKSLIKLFCIPSQPATLNSSPVWNLPADHPDKWMQFKNYAIRDVDALAGVYKKLKKFPLPSVEQKVWELNFKINQRGILVDQKFVECAIACRDAYNRQLVSEATELTGLTNPNSVQEYRQWVNDQGLKTDDLTKQTVADLLRQSTDDRLTRSLQIRQELSKTSGVKYETIFEGICLDGRFRDTSEYYGARTGRFSSPRMNVQNMPAHTLPDPELARDVVKANSPPEVIDLLFGPPNDLLSQLIRTAFTAQVGHRFISADFNAIEARILAYCAGCDWRLHVFSTHGRIYESSAEKMFGLPIGSVDKNSPYRKKGKIAELALGYGGGANALLQMGAHEDANEREDLKIKWRQANPEIVEFWYAIERAAIAAVQHRTLVAVPIGPLRRSSPSKAPQIIYRYQSGFLFCELPSGRHIAYVKPAIQPDDLIAKNSEGQPFVVARAGSLTFEGQDSKTRRWCRMPTYAGRLVENLIQGLARDVLRDAMLSLDEHGYQLLATIHDEVLIEMPYGQGSLDEVLDIMGRPLPWAPGLPLKAEGFETSFFAKEPVHAS